MRVTFRAPSVAAAATLISVLLAHPAAAQALDSGPRSRDPGAPFRREVLQIRRATAPRGVFGTQAPATQPVSARWCRVSVRNRVLIGAVIGAAAGGAVGAVTDHQVTGEVRSHVFWTFAAAGSGIGGIVGYGVCR